MVTMNELNEPEILENLRVRYQNDIFFTNIGPTLISMYIMNKKLYDRNPYKPIPLLLNDSTRKLYLDRMFSKEPFILANLPPHPYAVAA